MDILARDILAPEHLGTLIFWHLAKQYGHFGTDISAPVLLYQNVHVLKCPCAQMFLGQKFLVPKIPRAENRKIPMLNRSRVEMSICQKIHSANGARAEMFL